MLFAASPNLKENAEPAGAAAGEEAAAGVVFPNENVDLGGSPEAGVAEENALVGFDASLGFGEFPNTLVVVLAPAPNNGEGVPCEAVPNAGVDDCEPPKPENADLAGASFVWGAAEGAGLLPPNAVVAPNGEFEVDAGPPKLNLGAVVPLVVAPVLSAGALNPKAFEAGLVESPPRAPLSDDVDGAGVELGAAVVDLTPKLNFKPEEPAADVASAGAEVGPDCDGVVL